MAYEITLVNDESVAIHCDATIHCQVTVDAPLRAQVHLFAGSTDRQIAVVADRLEVPAEALMAFRDNSAHGQAHVLVD